MAKIAQFRYYQNGNPNNYPTDWVWDHFCADQSFRDFNPIHQLGIQTLPGTRVYINQSTNPVIIGGTGIFEINCDNTTAIISSLRFDQESMRTIADDPNAYLIVDIVYGSEED